MILGLDLGTSNSSFSLWDGKKLIVLPLEGQVSTPSLVLHDPLGKIDIGASAETHSAENPSGCFRSILRLLGACKTDVQALGSHTLYQYAPAPRAHNSQIYSGKTRLLYEQQSNPEMWIDEGYRLIPPAQIIAEYLLRLYRMAVAKLPDTANVTTDMEAILQEQDSNIQGSLFSPAPFSVAKPGVKLYITCPSYFNAKQRQTLRDAAALAQLPCQIVSESSANLMYFCNTLFKQLSSQKVNLHECLTLLYSWSGSKFECSVVVLDYRYQASFAPADGDQPRTVAPSLDYQGAGLIEVLAQKSRLDLSGDEITWAMVDILLKAVQVQYKVDLSNSKEAVHRLFIAAEKAKRELAEKPTTTIFVPYLWKDGGQDMHLEYDFSKDKLSRIYSSFVRKTYETCLKCLQEANLSWDKVSHLVAVGGVCQWPGVIDELKGLIKEGARPNSTFAQSLENELLRSLDLRLGRTEQNVQGHVPKCVSLDPALTPAAFGAALYGAYKHGDMGYQLKLVECEPYAWGLGAPSEDLHVMLPQFIPLPVNETQLITVSDQLKDQLQNIGGSCAFFVQDKEQTGDDGVRGTVTLLLRQGRSLFTELSLPHVTLKSADKLQRRSMNSIFPSTDRIAVVKVNLVITENHEMTITLSDANDPQVVKQWKFPETTLGGQEMKRLQQDLWFSFAMDLKRQQIATLRNLSMFDLLAYFDTHHEEQELFLKLTAQTAQAAQSAQPAQKDTDQPAGQSPVEAVLQSGRTKVEELDPAEQAALEQARAMLATKDEQELNKLELKTLGMVVDQSFNDALLKVLDKASTQLQVYNQCTSELNELKKLLKVALSEAQRWHNRYDQDLSNTKKFAIEGLVKELLPVFDALDQAVNFAREHKVDPAILQGQQQILELLQRVLQQHQVQIDDPTGQLFDPNLHQALSMLETSEVPAKHVAKTLQKGLILNGRVIRPAQVLVAKAPAGAEPPAADATGATGAVGAASAASASTPSAATAASAEADSQQVTAAQARQFADKLRAAIASTQGMAPHSGSGSQAPHQSGSGFDTNA